MDRELKEKLGLDPDKPIPSDYSVPYYIHENQKIDGLCKEIIFRG